MQSLLVPRYVQEINIYVVKVEDETFSRRIRHNKSAHMVANLNPHSIFNQGFS